MSWTIDEWFVIALARTIRPRETVFHGFGSPCAQVAMHVARRTHAPDILLVDLRESGDRARHGMLPGALHAPYPGIGESLRPGGMLREVAAATGRRIVFFCAFGERSAMAVKAAKEAGLANTAHLAGGIDAWKKAGGPVLTG